MKMLPCSDRVATRREGDRIMKTYTGYSPNNRQDNYNGESGTGVALPGQKSRQRFGAGKCHENAYPTGAMSNSTGYARGAGGPFELFNQHPEEDEDISALRWRRVLLHLSEVMLDSAREHDRLAHVMTAALNHAIERLLVHGDDADLIALEDWLGEHDERGERTTMPPLCILLVDDSATFLESAARFLAADERVQIAGRASSGREALDLVSCLHPDLVLMDLAMPGMNGLDVTREIKSRPNAPLVIIVTMHDNPEGREASHMAQADGFIAKPHFCSELPLLLDRLCA